LGTIVKNPAKNMKKLLTIVFMIVTCNLFSQEKTKEVTYYNQTFDYYEICNVLKADKTILHGSYERNVLNQMAVTGQYDHNKKTGEWKFYNSDGNINYSYNYSTSEFSNINANTENQIVILGNDTTICKVDRPVLYEGSNLEILNYLIHNIRYPEQAAENGIKGRVIVGLVINEDGAYEYVYIIRGVEESLNAEALRVFAEFEGTWFPATLDGQRVKSVFVYPVLFNL